MSRLCCCLQTKKKSNKTKVIILKSVKYIKYESEKVNEIS